MNPGPHHMYGSKYECNLGKDPDHEMLSSQGQDPDSLAKEERSVSMYMQPASLGPLIWIRVQPLIFPVNGYYYKV